MKQFIRNQLRSRPRVTKLIGGVVLKLSKWQGARFFLLRWLGKIFVLLAHIIFKDHYYKFLIFSQKEIKGEICKQTSSFKLKQFCSRILAGDATASVERYLHLLNETHLPAEQQIIWSSRFMEVGRLDLSLAGFQNLIQRGHAQLSGSQRLNILRQLGAVCFMSGKNKEANYYWQLAGQTRRSLIKPKTPTAYRILGGAWFAAIGHVAMLDFYLKYKRLYFGEQRIVVQWDIHTIPGQELFHHFQNMDINVLKPGELENDYNKGAKKNHYPAWQLLSEDEREALIDDFWEYDFPDGEILGYAHAAAKIQHAWEQAGHEPLFQLTDLEKIWLQNYLSNLGIPKDAWYVCLHVREAGFHKQWNSFYPSMRDAELDVYYDAIQKIVDAGGWVIRMGDSSMKPLRTMRNVVDYAHSLFKTQLSDILLSAGCRFFLGTNSGFATISVIYGTPCALSNWVPIGWPLWPSQDLMIPKLFREKSSKRYLTIQEIFSRNIGFIQNWSDLPDDIELVANTSEEIVELTLEMLLQTDSNHKMMMQEREVVVDLARTLYAQTAIQYEGFVGSRLGSAFVKKHADLFLASKTDFIETLQEEDTSWRAPSNDNMTVTSS